MTYRNNFLNHKFKAMIPSDKTQLNKVKEDCRKIVARKNRQVSDQLKKLNQRRRAKS